ncbi:MAG: c-type cytochrome [Oscillatoriales cyanobacterium SM2_1_8]|nr:c-type cytochrome [Oscillatoriales cyanobacterium SM2_1_8]
MKQILLVWVAALWSLLAFVHPAWAADAGHGKQIFKANCVACHAGGNNSVVRAKTLKKEALQEYNMYDAGAIAYQVTNGKNAMPAFGKRLQPQDVEDVVAYVLTQADNNWGK